MLCWLPALKQQKALIIIEYNYSQICHTDFSQKSSELEPVFVSMSFTCACIHCVPGSWL